MASDEQHNFTEHYESRTLFDIDSSLATFYVALVGTLAVIGTLGNCCLLFFMKKEKQMNPSMRMFITNNALADLCVSMIAEPMCIVGAVIGSDILDMSYGLCVVVASMCLTVCICTFLNMVCLTFNRYLFICHNKLYGKLFTKTSTLLMCISCWIVAMLFEAPNFLGWGGHYFDPKSHQCIWDRTADQSYTLFVSLGLITCPLIILAGSNMAILRQVWIANQPGSNTKSAKKMMNSSRILLTLFTVFLVCWTPYAVMLVVEHYHKLSLQAHLFITLLAHSHSIMSPIVYITYKRSFRKYLPNVCRCHSAIHPESSTDDTNTDNKKMFSAPYKISSTKSIKTICST